MTAPLLGHCPCGDCSCLRRGGGGFFDIYDNFVSNLNFKGGSWDSSGGPIALSLSMSYNHGGGSGGGGGPGGGGHKFRGEGQGGGGGGWEEGAHSYYHNTSHDGMIRKHMECKFAWDFSSADCIERELRMAGVVVDNELKAWRANGEVMEKRGGGRVHQRQDRGAGGHEGWADGSPRPPKVYCQRGAGHGLSPKQISRISALVAKRSGAKAAMDYAHGNKIFDLLSREYGVNIDNRAGKWALIHRECVFNPDASSFMPKENVMQQLSRKGVRGFLHGSAATSTWLTTYAASCATSTWWRSMTRKERMGVGPRGERWLNKDDKGGDESNIVSREEWEEEEDKDGNASRGIDFVNGSSANEDDAENDMVTMKNDDSK
jgi:hypothetical protein